MKVFSRSHDFDYSWDEVSTGNWLKYCPWNKEATHVIAVDTLSRGVDSATGIQPAPKWLTPFLGGTEVSHVYEVSYVKPRTPAASGLSASESIDPPRVLNDKANKPVADTPSVTMTSYNLTWSDLLSVRETVVYTPSPSDPLHKTRFDQEAKITALCGGWAKIKEKIENFTVERFGQNAERGRLGFESVLEMSRKAFAEERARAEHRL
ncbi:MAG: hypothetical protein Q9159_005352 [Coniocarpon cinnabarinum]